MTRTRRRSWGWICAAGVPALLLGIWVVRGETAAPPEAYAIWSDYGGSADSMQYSGLSDINTSNVEKLELVSSHMASGPSGRFSFGPLIVDDIMYVVGKDNAVVALDASTGTQIWLRPLDDTPTNRGFNCPSSERRPAVCNGTSATPAKNRPAGAATGSCGRKRGRRGRGGG